MTPKMRAVYTYIRQRIEADGIAPSYREICEHIGDDSRSSIHRIVRSLEDRRLIRRIKGRAMAIFLVDNLNDGDMTLLVRVRTAVADHKRGVMDANQAMREIARLVGEDAA